jgi:hypothetical protein
MLLSCVIVVVGKADFQDIMFINKQGFGEEGGIYLPSFNIHVDVPNHLINSRLTTR